MSLECKETSWIHRIRRELRYGCYDKTAVIYRLSWKLSSTLLGVQKCTVSYFCWWIFPPDRRNKNNDPKSGKNVKIEVLSYQYSFPWVQSPWRLCEAPMSSPTIRQTFIFSHTPVYFVARHLYNFRYITAARDWPHIGHFSSTSEEAACGLRSEGQIVAALSPHRSYNEAIVVHFIA